MAARLRGRPLAAVVAIGIGHNNGPPMATRWGMHCWRRAHAQAWKPPGPEVVRLRMRRAEELGLSYRQLASILMESGRTPAALVFALAGLLAPGRAERLRALTRPVVLVLADTAAGPADDRLHGIGEAAGGRVAGWRTASGPAGLADAALALLAAHGLPPSAAILVGASDTDRDCAARARLAAYLDADTYFRPTTTGPSR